MNCHKKLCSPLLDLLMMEVKHGWNFSQSKFLSFLSSKIPCITKSISGFKIITDPPTYITDTPGIIVPRIEDPMDGMKFCACNIIRDGIVELEIVCDFILFHLNNVWFESQRTLKHGFEYFTDLFWSFLVAKLSIRNKD